MTDSLARLVTEYIGGTSILWLHYSADSSERWQCLCFGFTFVRRKEVSLTNK